MWRIFTPFSPDVWAATVVVLLVTAVLMVLLDHIEPRNIRASGRRVELVREAYTLSKAVYHTAATCLGGEASLGDATSGAARVPHSQRRASGCYSPPLCRRRRLGVDHLARPAAAAVPAAVRPGTGENLPSVSAACAAVRVEVV